jgi:hypothetical protein
VTRKIVFPLSPGRQPRRGYPSLVSEPTSDPKEFLEETLHHPCGWCGSGTWFRLRAATWAGTISFGVPGHDEREVVAALYQCGGCARASLFTYQAWDGYGGWGHALLRTFPKVVAQEMGDLPTEVEADRVEAWNSFHAGLHRAAILMARSALQRATRVLDQTFRGSLFQELDNLVATGVITKQLRENADEVRLSGNDVAHPEELGSVSEADAKDSMAFLDDFLETALAIPARQQKRRADREGKS